MTGPVTTEALVAALTREPIELADGVTPEEVMRLALDGIDIAYRAHGDCARVSLLAVQADWIMQHLARTEAWAKDEQAKRHAAEDKLVEARSRAALAEAAHQQVTAERDEYGEYIIDLECQATRDKAELARLRAEGEAKDRRIALTDRAKAQLEVALNALVKIDRGGKPMREIAGRALLDMAMVPYPEENEAARAATTREGA